MLQQSGSHGVAGATLPSRHEESFPWKHILGFVLSLILTGAALWAWQAHVAHGQTLDTLLMVFGVLQIFVQLLLFMHMSEGGTRVHVWMIILGFFFTFVVVAASIWVMSFGSQVQ